MTRKQKKEEETRVLKEFDEALAAERGKTAEESTPAPKQKYRCKRCKTELQEGVCPVCGYKIYTPMSEEKRKRIRFIVGGVCVVIFLILFFIVK